MRTFALASLSCLVVASCSSTPPCELHAKLLERAGSGAKDCGHVAIGTDRATVDACVLDAYEKHRPFVAQYDQQGIDSRVIDGLASDAAGHLTVLGYDGDPSGGGGAPPRIEGFVCVNPSTATASTTTLPSSSEPFACESRTPIDPLCGG